MALEPMPVHRPTPAGWCTCGFGDYPDDKTHRPHCNVWLTQPPPNHPHPQAFKSDAGKPDFALLMDGMPNGLLDVVKVLSWAVAEKKEATWADGGGKGYRPHSWKEVPEAKRRYRAALQRHENAIARGEVNDPESGLPHRAHIACNSLFLAELDYIKE